MRLYGDVVKLRHSSLSIFGCVESKIKAMLEKQYEAPRIVKGSVFLTESKKSVTPALSFESKVLGQLQETIKLIVNRNSGDYQTTFRLSKKRLKKMLNQQRITPSGHTPQL